MDSETLCLKDADGDGRGDANPPVGIYPGTDCMDDDPFTYNGAAYLESTTQCRTDADGDGYGSNSPSDPTIYPGDDCDDLNPAKTPSDLDEDGFSTCDEDCNDNKPFYISRCCRKHFKYVMHDRS